MVPRRWIVEAPLRPERVAKIAAEWMSEPTLRNVFESFEIPELSVPSQAFTAWLTDHFDTRKGKERQEVEVANWSGGKILSLFEAAFPLGLVETAQPQYGSYDYAVIMAGTPTANRLRASYIAQLVREGLKVDTVIALGSGRKLRDSELNTVENIVDTTEWADLARAISDEFGGDFDPPDLIDAANSTVVASSQRILLLSAPSSDQTRRANSTDAFNYLIDQLDKKLGKALVVTSAIYAPYTFFTFVSLLGSVHLDFIEIIGTPTSLDRDAPLLAQRFAQEILSTVIAINALV
jgi:hypothetical protein